MVVVLLSLKRVVLGGPRVRWFRASIADPTSATEVHMFKDSSMVPLLALSVGLMLFMPFCLVLVGRVVLSLGAWSFILNGSVFFVMHGPSGPLTWDDFDAGFDAGVHLGIDAFAQRTAGSLDKLARFIRGVVVHRRDTAIRGWRTWVLEDPYKWLRPDLVPPSPFLSYDPCLTTGGMFFECVQKKKPTAASLDRWGWREFKSLPLPWFDKLAKIPSLFESCGVWPDGILDAYIAMTPKVDGDAAHLGQRPLCVLPIAYRIWASARLQHFHGWFQSWVPSSVFSAGGARSSVEAWYSTTLDLEESLSGALDSDVHIFVADVVKSFDTVDRGILDYVLSRLGLPGCLGMSTLSTMLFFGLGLSCLVVMAGLGMEGSHKDAP